MRLDWYPEKIKFLYLVLGIAIQGTLLAKPVWLHSDYIAICDWLITTGVFITIIATFLQNGIHFLHWLLLLLALLFSLTTLQFNEEFDFYLMRIEYFVNRQLFVSDSLATWLEIVNLCCFLLWCVLQSWIIIKLFSEKRPLAGQDQ